MTKGNNTLRVVYDEWGDNRFQSKLRKIGTDNPAYTSMNMQVYENGTLGTRPWLRLRTVGAAIPPDKLFDNEAFIAWRPIPDNALGELWVHSYNSGVFVYDFTADAWLGAGVPSGVDAQVTTSDNHGSYWGARHGWDSSGALVGSAMHTVLPEDNWVFGGGARVKADDTVAAVDWGASAGGEIVNFTSYRDRLWGWQAAHNTTTQGNRLTYTNEGSYVLAGDLNYIEFGIPSGAHYIIGVWVVRDSLLVAISDGGWWVFTGTPARGTKRFIGTYPIPAHGAVGTILNNAVYFLAPFGRQVMVATPSGVDTTSLSHVRPFNESIPWDVFHDYRGLSSQQEQSVHLTTLRNNADQWFAAVEVINNNWTYTMYGKLRADAAAGNLGVLRDCAVVGQGTAYAFLMDDPDTGLSPLLKMQLYTRDIVLNRPSRSTDEWSDSKEVAAGATSTIAAKGMVKLAPFSPEGEEVRVRQVTVDYQYWSDDDSVYEDPDMRCILLNGDNTLTETIDTFAGGDLITLQSLGKGVDEAIGTPARHIFRFPVEDQQFRVTQQIQIDDILSISIDRILVDYEIRPDNHWAGKQEGT